MSRRATKLSAVNRVWQMPELALSIMKNLERERLDLIQLSLVSKSMRNLALRALVRNLDIPLSKIAKVGYLLEQNADLAAEIQHVRLWDDEAHRINRIRDTLPTLDLSFGIANVGSLKLVLANSEHALAAIVALRVVVDYAGLNNSDSTQASPSETWQNLAGVSQWDAVRTLAQEIRDRQQGHGGSTQLSVFHIEDCCLGCEGRHSLRPFIWKSLVDALDSGLTTLRLQLSQNDLDGSSGLKDAIDQDANKKQWGQLRKVAIILPAAIVRGQNHRLQDLLRGFFERQVGLVDIELCGDQEGDVDVQQLFQQTFPDLRAFSVQKISSSIDVSFLERHSDLQELRLVQALIASGSRPTQIELTDTYDRPEPYEFLEWITPDSPEAKAITCLSFEWRWEISVLRDLIPRLGFLVSSSRLPALCELVIIEDDPEAVNDPDSQPDPPPGYCLGQLLSALLPALNLRAVHIKVAVGRSLTIPEDTDILRRLPPLLEYISWHSSSENRTQYFRVVRASRLKEEYGILEELPSSFALHSVGPGLWDAPGLRRRDDTLFDHTVTPPRLKPWS
ncbi:hypothetical protein V8E36_009858 [Tilletia maclaganii]